MILKKHDTGSYRTTTYAWWTEDIHAHRLSPNFHSETDALEWFDIIKESIERTLNEKKPEPISEECTCENCGCNGSPKELHADSKNSSRRKNKTNLKK